MTDSMIERVARAVREEIAYPSGDGAEWMVEGGFRGGDFFADIARAVLTAMREPTREMLDAGFLAKPGKDGLIPPVHAWPAMIDAALAEDGR